MTEEEKSNERLGRHMLFLGRFIGGTFVAGMILSLFLGDKHNNVNTIVSIFGGLFIALWLTNLHEKRRIALEKKNGSDA